MRERRPTCLMVMQYLCNIFVGPSGSEVHQLLTLPDALLQGGRPCWMRI